MILVYNKGYQACLTVQSIDVVRGGFRGRVIWPPADPKGPPFDTF